MTTHELLGREYEAHVALADNYGRLLGWMAQVQNYVVSCGREGIDPRQFAIDLIGQQCQMLPSAPLSPVPEATEIEFRINDDDEAHIVVHVGKMRVVRLTREQCEKIAVMFPHENKKMCMGNSMIPAESIPQDSKLT